jgi:hypothetical protein
LGALKYIKEEVTVTDKFILKFSELYIKQRSQTNFDYESIDDSLLFQKSGFDATNLKNVITKNSVAKDIIREKIQNRVNRHL